MLSWNFKEAAPVLLGIDQQEPIRAVMRTFNKFIKLIQSDSRHPVSKCILAVFGVKHPDSDYLHFLDGQLICERGRTVIQRYLDSKKATRPMFYIDQDLRNVSGDAEIVLEQITTRLALSLSNYQKALLTSFTQRINELREYRCREEQREI